MDMKKVTLLLFYSFFIISSIIFIVRDILLDSVTLKTGWFLLLLFFGSWQIITNVKK